MIKKVFILLVLLVGTNIHLNAQTEVENADDISGERWVDSVYNNLSDKQKIAQMFMVAAYSNLNESHYQKLEALIKEYNIGGLLFMQGGPGRQINLVNRYQKAAPTPLLIGMDLEYGLAMRLDSTIAFPKQMTLGAIKNEQYIYNLGAEIARQCKLIGVHVNFAPVLDINSNPNNPVIGLRSFGEDKREVAEKGKAFMQGLQDNGIIANAKHFPGHGDTDKDSHYSLPVINHDLRRLHKMELYPFKSLMDQGLMSTMIAHMHIPTIDSTKNLPSTLSKKLVTGLLKESMQFEGLIFTDALNMRAVTRYFPPTEVNLMAVEAGNDMLLFPENVPESIAAILKNIENGTISWQRIEASVKKILRAKYWAGLHQFTPLDHRYILDKLNTPMADLLNQKLYEKSVTIAKNVSGILPIRNLETQSFASLSIGSKPGNLFQKTLSKYVNFKHHHVSSRERDIDKYDQLFHQLKNYKTVVVGVHDIFNSARKNYGTNEVYLNFLNRLQKVTEVIVVVFGNPYSLRFFDEMGHVICTYEENKYSHKIAPQIIFGALASRGHLPVTASEEMSVHLGVETKPLGRLGYSLPEDVGLDSEVLKRIDIIAEEAITDKATPGCQILVAKNGAVVYEKSYGYLTYEKQQAVTNEIIYDLASLTKVVATLQSIMFLYDQGLLDVNQKASHYLHDLKGTNKEDMIIKDILMHQAGLLTFIPFWVKTVDEQGLKKEIYNSAGSPPYEIEITPEIYGLHSLQDSVWHWIKSSDLRPLKKYRDKYDYKYSDLGFFILHRLAEKLLNQRMDEFLVQNFYQPLGMNFLSYQPLKKLNRRIIAPTEYDNYFRNSLIHGTVHDPAAAMIGGIAGHAGVFGNANDIAKLLQMNLQDGIYGGTQYFQSGTINRFTKRQIKDNRRGLGWDKPELEDDNGPTSLQTSPATYGHTGFTGTAAWVDPVNDLIYIFLSNRIYPSANNFKLIQKNIRTRIQDIIYQAIVK
ncbi:glycoside hydrolase family 3 N-terminal domain-containing protein [Fulvivirgaceae bacterium BMA12]|uniref:beta-N-acetylhexosaminidase n=1 Tax=Agaribacillus aureus TaxID=3051825 RepID=A0ABT8L493_9BACT|nr:glycoside hydrolase family 3 N-terminal domain-containing protein [Fulvivirgaceae bacterium BMA12]